MASLASAVTNSWRGRTPLSCMAGPSGWYEFNGASYKFFNEQLDWGSAEDKCLKAGKGAHLVSIHSQSEAEIVECLRHHQAVSIK